MIHRSPKKTRGRTPWFFSSTERVSVACRKSSVRVSAHSCLPKKYGELAPSASCGPTSAWAAFQAGAKSCGLTCRCSCTLVQADSGAIVSAYIASRSPSASGAAMSMKRSSPRAAKTASLSIA